MPEFDRYAEDYETLLRDPIRDRFAPGSAFFFERKWELLRAFARQANLNLKTASWLDVGCGKGDLLKIGSKEVAKASGCDVSEEMLAACKGLDVKLQTDTNRLPFADAQFDLITAVCVYHHVPPPARSPLTTELKRVLKPGGVAGIIEHNPFNPVTQLIVKRTPVDADAILLTAGESRRLFSGVGLTPKHTEYFLYFPEGVYKRLSWLEAALSKLPGGGQYAVFAQKPR